MSLIRMLRAAVAREPQAVAIVEGARRLTYAAWLDRIERLAGGLAKRGIAAGDHVVAVLGNRIETTELYWACQAIGAIFTPFNWRASAADLAYVLADAEARLLVYEDRSAEAVAGCAFDHARMVRLDGGGPGSAYDDLLTAEPMRADPGIGDAAIGLMLYTSGTTGRPKGVPRSHGAERAAAISCIAHLRYRHGTVSLGVMPLFHTMGIRALLMSSFLGGRFVACPSFSAEAALAAIAAERIEALFLVPTMFHDLVRHPRIAGADIGSVENIAYAGMTMTGALVASCQRVFRPRLFSNFYGSSEIYTFSISNDVAAKPGCAGRAGLGQTLRIVRADADARVSPDETLPAGESGEIIASMRGLDAFAGYWKRPDADEKAIRDGWYFTGDLGRFDGDGELYVLGRVDDMIVSGGENIHAEEVEDVLAKSPLVRGVAVIGEADARLGERIVAFIEPAGPKARAKALDAHCLASGLARFKRPRAYRFIAAIPRSAAGKLLRRHLRDGDFEALNDHDTAL